MAFGGFDPAERSAPIAEINMTPLIDVMLVLLVIFIIAAPLLGHAIRLDLPHAPAPPAPARDAAVILSIDRDSRMYWNDKPIDAAALRAALQTLARRQPDATVLQLRADQATPYRAIAQAMAMAQAAGVARLGFVTDRGPEGQPPGR
jgi:biopolymer transport protein ExbD